MLSLDQSIALAAIEPGEPGELLQRVALRGAERFLALLPADVRDALSLSVEAASALAKISSGGGVDSWLAVLSKAQDKWVGVVNEQWEILPRCRETIRVAAAKRTPVDLLATVPLAQLVACGEVPKKNPRPGIIYWKPSGVGAVVENWSYDLAPTVGVGLNRQSWVPDHRKSRDDGLVFAPALAPYSIPGELPTTWGPAVSAVMARRYQELLRLPAEKVRWDSLDFLFHRTMSILVDAKFFPAGEIAWDKMVGLERVQKIPSSPDPSKVYITPAGALWSVTDDLELWCAYEAPTRVMKITIRQAKALLAALGGLAVKRALAAKQGGVSVGSGSVKGQGGGGGGVEDYGGVLQLPSTGRPWGTLGFGAALSVTAIALGVRRWKR